MEECRTFLEIITELLEKGYTIDFNLFENTFDTFQKDHASQLPTDDFLIDEIHCCADEMHSGHPMFIVAISSKKHKIKGILLNAFVFEDSMSILQRIQRLHVRWKILVKQLKHWFKHVIKK